MSIPTTATILRQVRESVQLTVDVTAAKAASDTGYGSLVTCLNAALKDKRGVEHIKDALFELADDTSATAGNPFHKLRSTLGNRCTPKQSVKTVTEDDEIIDFVVKRKGKGKPKADVTTDAAYNALVAWVERKATSDASFGAALLKHDAAKIRKAIAAGVRTAA